MENKKALNSNLLSDLIILTKTGKIFPAFIKTKLGKLKEKILLHIFLA